jgi:biotin carboxylase
MGRHLGSVDRLVTILENAQVPVGAVRERLGIPGMSAGVADNFRDKARMKAAFEAAGVPCARSARVASASDATTFAERVGYPFVAKPPAGAGARNTFRVDGPDQLASWLRDAPPTPDEPMVLEEFVRGQEHSFDSVVVDGHLRWYSISRYVPSPLDVLSHPWIQWCVLLPRRIDGPEFNEIRAAAGPALAALGLNTGMTHMEWFRRAQGGIAISEVAARPPGAQFTTLISYACNLDFYRAWPRLMIFDEFDPPRRDYATGAAYLRGMGQGRVKAVHGLAQAQKELGALVVEARLPQAGQMQPSGYEGSGYIVLRHPDTRTVEQALARAVELIRVELG